MTIGVIGGNGFIGKKIVEALKSYHLVISITKENYELQKNINFDIIINANGNSHKYWANLNVLKDFEKSVISVYKTIFDFKYKKYIYISSIDAEVVKTSYGFHKHLAEILIKFYCKDYSIIRMPGVISKNATKGVVYDILNGNLVYLTSDSTLMLMDVDDIAENLKKLIKKNKLKYLEKFYPSENITVDQIGELLKIPVKYGDKLRQEYFNYKGKYGTSRDYLKNMK